MSLIQAWDHLILILLQFLLINSNKTTLSETGWFGARKTPQNTATALLSTFI